MRIFTKSIKDKLIANHKKHIETLKEENPTNKEPKAVVKLFNPTGIGTWYLSELDPETNIAFGLCDLGEPELGYVSIDEILNFKGRFGLGIERDLSFKSIAFKNLMEGKNK